MKITLEIKNLKDWEILLPLLKRLKIKVLNSLNPKDYQLPPKHPAQKDETPNNLMQFAGILSDEEASIFESAVVESRKLYGYLEKCTVHLFY